MKTCIYPGSFDPIHYGHIDIIDRLCKVFDRVLVAIGTNPDKNCTFTVPERIRMIQKTISFPEKVEVVSFTGLLADYAIIQNVNTIIKGVRDNQDFDYERLLHEISITQQNGIDTHILIASKSLSHVSSKAIKQLCVYQGKLHEYVPLIVKDALERRLNGQTIIGVTGEIGAGKSYVCEQLKNEFNSVINIDCDVIAHSLYTRQEPYYQSLREKIKSTFNLESLSDRKKLGEIVFNDIDALNKLNEMTRIPILTAIRETMAGKKGILLLNGALLAESNMLDLCNNNVILVMTSTTEQRNNLYRRGLTDAQIDRRIYSQLTTAAKAKRINDKVLDDDYGHCIVYLNTSDDKYHRGLSDLAKRIRDNILNPTNKK